MKKQISKKDGKKKKKLNQNHQKSARPEPSQLDGFRYDYDDSSNV